MAAHPKRKLDETDPDYETLENQQAKRQRALEEDGRQNARRKVQAVIHREFQTEISNKEREFQQVDMRLNEARLMLDRLRACIVANYYGLAGTSAQSQQASFGKSEAQSIHPAVKGYIGKAPKNQYGSAEEVDLTDASAQSLCNDIKDKECWDRQMEQNSLTENLQSSLLHENAVQATHVDSPSLNMSSQNPTFDDRRARLKIKRKVIVGNVSKYIPVDQREPNDMSSHKWMIYVRGPKSDPDIGHFVKRVWFFLHHSYKPNDLVEISKPPFHLTRRGWGEFPVRVQLHFLDPRNKKVDIFHHLKLDKTFTGLQKLGGETVVEVELERDSFEETQAPYEKPGSSASKSSLSSSSSSVSSQNEQVTNAGKASPSVCRSNLDLNDSKTQGVLSVKEIKTEIVSFSEELPHEYSDARSKSTTENSCSEFSSGEIQLTKTHRKHKDVGDDKFLKESDENFESDICTTITASVSNSDAHTEYNVTIAHFNDEEQSCQDDQVVDVCGGDEITVKTESVVENQNPYQSERAEGESEFTNAAQNVKSKQMQFTPCPSRPTQGFVSANIYSKQAHNVMSHISPKKSSPPVSLISAEGLCRRSLNSSLKSSHEHSSKSHNPKNISEQHKDQKSASTSVPLSFLSTAKLQALQNGNVPLKLQVSNHQNNLNSQNTNSDVNASGGNIQSSPSPSGILPLSSNSIQQFKVINFQKVIKANTSHPTMVLKTMPNATTAKIISSAGTVTSVLNPAHKDSTSTSLNDKKSLQPVSVLQNEDFKKRALVVHVQPNAAPAKILLKPDTKFVPSIPNVTLVAPQSHKKQVSLLTGLVIDPPKAIHSSNAKSLLRPGTCKLVENSKNPNASQTGMASDKTKDVFRAAGKTVLINSAPVNSNKQMTKTLKVSEDVMFVPTTRMFTPGQTLVSNSLLQKCDSPRGISQDLSSLNFPMSYERKSAIGITKHKYSDMHRQAIGKGKKPVNRSDFIEGTVEIIPHLSLEDFPNIRCLVKAAVKLHPLIQANVNKLTHPYCAMSREQWESWPVGKQRAAEWHRACFVLKYLKLCLNGESQFKGEKLMSKRQLVHWCRLHAFSPQPAIFQKKNEDDDLTPTADQGETSMTISNVTLGLKSTTKLKEAESLLQRIEKSVEDKERSEDIDVVADDKSIATSSVKNKRLITDTSGTSAKLMPVSEGATFVNEWMRQRGIRFSPNHLEKGVMAYTAPNMIFEAMLEFGADIIRKAYCVNAEQGSSSGKLSIKDVHCGLIALPEASFCSNQFLGKEEEEESDNRFKHEKEIYR